MPSLYDLYNNANETKKNIFKNISTENVDVGFLQTMAKLQSPEKSQSSVFIMPTNSYYMSGQISYNFDNGYGRIDSDVSREAR